MTEEYIVVTGVSSDVLMIVDKSKHEATDYYEYVAGPMTYKDCKSYIETGDIHSGPYIPPEDTQESLPFDEK
ncbi:hypothetical protein [Photobacterium indicum]|uniref:hypothetical protein n=1 Tax=Photobacterium indicum TaxID=81447 RepID=UPI003D0999FC